jgi:hypothetical protein
MVEYFDMRIDMHVMIQLQYMPILLTELVYDALHKGENVLK